MRWDAAASWLLLMLYFSLTNLSSALVENRGCNRTVRNSVGWIRWTGRMGRCVVRIRAPIRDPQIIEIRIRKMQVGVLRNSRCEGAYVQFFDELEDLDESTGRYCGHAAGNTTRLFLRRGPDLTIVMDSDSQFAAENPVIFSAQFSIVPARLANERHHVPAPLTGECPVECTNRNDRRTCRLVSPGYPGVYPRGVGCRVSLESSMGRFRIGGDPEDLFNLMNLTSQESCHTENCEEHVEKRPLFDRRSLLRTAEEDRSYGRDRFVRSPLNPVIDRDQQDEIMIQQEESGDSTSKSSKNKHHHYHHHHRRRRRPGMLRSRESTNIEILEGSRIESDKSKRSGLRERLSLFPGQEEGESNSNRVRHGGHSHREKSTDHERTYLDPMVEGEDEGNERFFDEFSKIRKSSRNEHPWSKHRSRKDEKTNAPLFEQRFLRRRRLRDKLGSEGCVGDYLAILENINGKLLEISRFCGEGRVPQILSRGRNVIVQFYAERDGTIMHDGFQLTLQETEAIGVSHEKHCDFVYRSSERSRENIRSMRSWYPPNTLCSYRFLGKPNERVSVHLKIVRDELPHEPDERYSKKNATLNYCPGNEIAVYNDAHSNGSSLVWSFCDTTLNDINNIQVPIVSTGSAMLIQYYSAQGSYDGQDFTYSISYKFIRKVQNTTKRRHISDEETKSISLRPVNFSALNLTDNENCNCDFSDRIGSFKSWFIVLVVLGVISFVGAVVTIIALLAKCIKMRATEKKLLQTPKR